MSPVYKHVSLGFLGPIHCFCLAPKLNTRFEEARKMIGPREIGAGTPTLGSNLQSHSSSYSNRNANRGSGVPRTPAQQLIDQYERMSTPPSGSRAPSPGCTKSTYRRQYTSDPKAHQIYGSHRRSDFMDQGQRKKEGRSPIRQSFRNLLSVIKKGAEGITKRKSEDKLGVPYSSLGRVGKDHEKDGPPPSSFSRATDPAQKRNVQSSTVASTNDDVHLAPHSRKRMTGPLLYLSRDVQLFSPDVPGPLMWTNCSVTIDGNKLVVSSIVDDIDSTVHEISLLLCTDIRSLSTTQLTSEEANLLERIPESDKMRVFEVLFEGRQREKFAAKSVRERAGWISVIWDAILPTHTDAVTLEEPTGLVATCDDRNKQMNLPVESPRPQPLPQTSPLLNPSHSERSLPPLPPHNLLPSTRSLAVPESKHNVPNLHLDLSDLQGPISPSIYPPTSHVPSPAATSSLISPEYPIYTPGSYFVASPTSMTATSASSCPSSPSITNLSQLSVVRHRLAQIERNHSHLSGQSIATQRTTPLPSPTSSSGWSKREAIFRNTGPKTPSKLRPMSPPEDRPVVIPQSHIKRTSRQVDSSNASQEVLPTRGPKLEASKDEIRKLSRGLADIKGVIGGESGHPTVHQMVLALEHHARSEAKALRNIQDTLVVFGEHIADVVVSTPRKDLKAMHIDPAVVKDTNEKVMESLKEVKDRLAVDLPALAIKLEEMQKSQASTSLRNRELENVSSSAKNYNAATCEVLKPVLDGLEEIRALCKIESNIKGDTGTTQYVEKILSLVQEDSNKQTLLSRQQADSVRYLNELNSWLEAFVNNGTSQIQSISANLDRLCQELGFNERANGSRSHSGPQPNLVNDIRQLMAGMKARDQNFASLQAAVHSLLEVLTVSQTQQGSDSQAIAGLMNQQRHDQEVLFRTFTNEISGEIKGERLRFVEAMKEATAINVQLHVEQFKQELGREVMAMTEEVGRLQREKLHVENQISDLFSFYSKHKQGEQPLQTIQENVVLPAPTRQVQDKSRSNLPRSHHHRLLPYPR